MAAVRAAQARGVAVSAEVSPHHLCLTDDTVRTLDTNRKMNPPLRSEDDRQALLDGLRDGTIACIATDHAPHARHEKDAPFEEAPFGVTGLETAFAAIYTYLVEPGDLELGLVLERMSAGPARVFGLPVPRIEVGESANLVLLDLDATWTRDRGRLPLEVGQLLAPRRDADAARSSRRSPTEGWCTRHEQRLSRTRRRHRLPGPLGRSCRRRVRRGRLHDGDDRLPGDGDRPELRGPARRVHGADDRQLRRRRRPARVAHSRGSRRR